MQDLVIRGARPWGGQPADIAVREGRIAAIGPDLPAAPERRLWRLAAVS